MANKKPLVITDGNIEQLQAGDNLSAGSNTIINVAAPVMVQML